MPKLRDYKLLEIGDDRCDVIIRSAKADLPAATKALTGALMNEPDRLQTRSVTSNTSGR